jgi:hypothetical protein
MRYRKFLNSHRPGCVLILVNPDDIGAFIAAAFNDPYKFRGQTVAVVSENMRVDNKLEEFGRASGRPIEAIYRTPKEMEKMKSDRFVAAHLICIGLDNFVDIEEVMS